MSVVDELRAIMDDVAMPLNARLSAVDLLLTWLSGREARA